MIVQQTEEIIRQEIVQHLQVKTPVKMRAHYEVQPIQIVIIVMNRRLVVNGRFSPTNDLVHTTVQTTIQIQAQIAIPLIIQTISHRLAKLQRMKQH